MKKSIMSTVAGAVVIASSLSSVGVLASDEFTIDPGNSETTINVPYSLPPELPQEPQSVIDTPAPSCSIEWMPDFVIDIPVLSCEPNEIPGDLDQPDAPENSGPDDSDSDVGD